MEMQMPDELKNAARHCSGRHPICYEIETQEIRKNGKRSGVTTKYKLTFATKSRKCERVASVGNWVVQMMPYVTIILLGWMTGHFYCEAKRQVREPACRMTASQTTTTEFMVLKK